MVGIGSINLQGSSSRLAPRRRSFEKFPHLVLMVTPNEAQVAHGCRDELVAEVLAKHVQGHTAR